MRSSSKVGISSGQPSPSPTLRSWMSSCNRSETAERRSSSVSAPSREDTSYTTFSRLLSRSLALRLASSLRKECLQFSSSFEEPFGSVTIRPIDSEPNSSENRTRANWSLRPSASWTRSGSISFLSCSGVGPLSNNREAAPCMQLSISQPWTSLMNCTAYSSIGSYM